MPRYGGIVIAGLAGYAFGKAYVCTSVGDVKQIDYLRTNRSEILSGEKQF